MDSLETKKADFTSENVPENGPAVNYYMDPNQASFFRSVIHNILNNKTDKDKNLIKYLLFLDDQLEVVGGVLPETLQQEKA